MSAKLTGLVWELDLPHKKQSLLLALADNAHDDGTNCYPGVDYLVWKTGYDRRSVQRILRQLEADGLLVPVAGGAGGRGRELEYRIDISKGTKKRPWKEVKAETRGAGKRAAKSRPSEKEKGGNLTPFGGPQKGRQNDQERAANETQKGGKSNTPPSITEPTTNQLPNTHTARATPDEPPGGAGVCASGAPAAGGDAREGGGLVVRLDTRANSNGASAVVTPGTGLGAAPSALRPGERACPTCGLVVSLDLLERYVRNHPHLGTGYINSALRECNGHELIMRWLERVAATSARLPVPSPDVANCPDCKGSGHYFEDPTDPKTHRRCTHPRLAEPAGAPT